MTGSTSPIARVWSSHIRPRRSPLLGSTRSVLAFSVVALSSFGSGTVRDLLTWFDDAALGHSRSLIFAQVSQQILATNSLIVAARKRIKARRMARLITATSAFSMGQRKCPEFSRRGPGVLCVSSFWKERSCWSLCPKRRYLSPNLARFDDIFGNPWNAFHLSASRVPRLCASGLTDFLPGVWESMTNVRNAVSCTHFLGFLRFFFWWDICVVSESPATDVLREFWNLVSDHFQSTGFLVGPRPDLRSIALFPGVRTSRTRTCWGHNSFGLRRVFDECTLARLLESVWAASFCRLYVAVETARRWAALVHTLTIPGSAPKPSFGADGLKCPAWFLIGWKANCFDLNIRLEGVFVKKDRTPSEGGHMELPCVVFVLMVLARLS